MDHSYGAVVYADRSGSPLFLLVLHAHGAHWDLPKGHPLPGERPEETILREVREETGCDVRLLAGFADSVSYVLPQGEPKRVDFRLARLQHEHEVSLPNDEIRAVRWVTFDEACQLMSFDNSREVLKRAYRHVCGCLTGSGTSGASQDPAQR
jgi:8-oxo-dGTP pyrophosphatase MutT (NUDIX family)